MKNRKGFTLIELIGVIILLGIIALITYPIVGAVIEESQQKAYEKQISELERLSYTWITRNLNKLTKDESIEYKLNFSELNDSGLVSSSQIMSPITGENIPGCIIVTYEESTNKFIANYSESC